MALTELARHLPRQDSRNRFLRGGLRSPRSEGVSRGLLLKTDHLELPPGASFEPNPQGNNFDG
jgi:putative (di)nucleoside polyphosphate hydrolase